MTTTRLTTKTTKNNYTNPFFGCFFSISAVTFLYEIFVRLLHRFCWQVVVLVLLLLLQLTGLLSFELCFSLIYLWVLMPFTWFLQIQALFLPALDIPKGQPTTHNNQPLNNCLAAWINWHMIVVFLTKEGSFLTVFSRFCISSKPFACICQEFHQPEHQYQMTVWERHCCG